MSAVLTAYRAGVSVERLKMMTHDEIQSAVAEQAARRERRQAEAMKKARAANLEHELDLAKVEYVERFARWLGLDATRDTNQRIAEEAWK